MLDCECVWRTPLGFSNTTTKVSLGSAMHRVTSQENAPVPARPAQSSAEGWVQGERSED